MKRDIAELLPWIARYALKKTPDKERAKESTSLASVLAATPITPESRQYEAHMIAAALLLHIGSFYGVNREDNASVSASYAGSVLTLYFGVSNEDARIVEFILHKSAIRASSLDGASFALEDIEEEALDLVYPAEPLRLAVHTFKFSLCLIRKTHKPTNT